MSEAIKYKVINSAGKSVSEMELNPEVFAVTVQPSVIHQVVRWQLARRRQGSHATKNIAKMDNTSKKIYRQKGTGRARAGHKYSPTRVGGAVAFGPQPRSYDFKINKKIKSKALCAVLSEKCAGESIYIVDDFKLSAQKTKEFIKTLNNFADGLATKKVLFVVNDENVEKADLIKKAGRNINKLKFVDIAGLNVYDLVNADCVICEQADVDLIQKRFINE